MQKIKITYKQAKACDWTLWTISMILAFSVDWRIGVALVCYDAMRAFENIEKKIQDYRAARVQDAGSEP